MSKQDEVLIKRDKTQVVNCRVDVRTMADLLDYFSSKGELVRSKSWLVRLSMELCRQVLSDNNVLPKVYMSLEEAINRLEEAGLGNPLESARGKVKLHNLVVAEDLMVQGSGPEAKAQKDDAISSAVQDFMRELQDE